MKHAAFLFFLCQITIQVYSQTGYYEIDGYEDPCNKGDIQRSNDGQLIIVNEGIIQKTDEVGNVIWRTEKNDYGFSKLITLPTDGYYVFGSSSMEHFSEEGESVFYKTFSLEDFGYTDDDFSLFSTSMAYYNGTGFTCVAYPRDEITDDIIAYYWLKYEMTIDGNILWQDLHYMGTPEDGYIHYKGIFKAGSYDYIAYMVYDGDSVNQITDKTPVGSGVVIATINSPTESLVDIFPVSGGNIVHSYDAIGFQTILTKILSASGDTAWTSSFDSGDVGMEFITELSSGNLLLLHQAPGYLCDLSNDSTYVWLNHFYPEADSITENPPLLVFEDIDNEIYFMHGMTVLEDNRLAFTGHNFNSGKGFILITDSTGYYYKLTSITDGDNDNMHFNIYPNPTQKNLTIDLAANAPEEIEILIIDLLGNLCLTDRIQPNYNSKLLEVSDLKTGNYFITLKGKNKNYGTTYVTIVK